MPLMILTWLLGGAALLSFLGTAVVFLRGSRDKGTIETLTRSNAALNEEAEIQGRKITALEADARIKDARIEALELAKGVLVNTANSSDAIAELRTVVLAQVGETTALIGQHHEAAMEGVSDLHKDLLALPKALAKELTPLLTSAMAAASAARQEKKP